MEASSLSSLTAVIGIDGNVLRCQVTSKDSRTGGSLAFSEVNTDFNKSLVRRIIRMLIVFGVFHVITQFFFDSITFQNKLSVGENCSSPQGQGHVPNIGITAVFSHVRSNRTRQATRIGIVSTDGALEQGRVDNVSTQTTSFQVRAREVGDCHTHDVCRAFAISDQVRSQSLANLQEGRFEFRLVRVFHLVRSNQRHSVTRRFVAIHRNRIVRFVGNLG
mmetsp:Transcript_16611/g.36334  ORF Transcript_16611/g.36334 Transcript_16611/m.36334 type:complete len:219 (+) Transcript_16611:79-735(+)